MKAIRSIVKTEIQSETKPIKKDLSALQITVEANHKELKKDIKKLDTKFIKLFNFLDKDVSSTRRRLNRHDKLLEVDTTNL